MKQETIFDEDFLNAHLTYYHLSKIDGLERKKEILNDWFQRYKSGKLSSQNESSIGADFINDIFGDILGFNYRNPNNWNLEKELKTLIDGKKPDELDSQFAPYFYRELLSYEVVNIDFKDYFDKYIKWIDKSKGNGAYKLWNGEPELNNLVCINFALVIYALDIDPNDSRIKQLSNLCDWHEWLISLDSYDYSKFKSEWILIFHNEIFLKRFSKITQIRDKVKVDLNKEYHPRLAEIYIKYLN